MFVDINIIKRKLTLVNFYSLNNRRLSPSRNVREFSFVPVPYFVFNSVPQLYNSPFFKIRIISLSFSHEGTLLILKMGTFA